MCNETKELTVEQQAKKQGVVLESSGTLSPLLEGLKQEIAETPKNGRRRDKK